MLSRRNLLTTGAAATAAGVFALPALASVACNIAMCDARIPTGSFPHISQPPISVLCWAATIAMICKWHHRQISMQNIVQQTFGAPVNAPANPVVLINSVDRTYVDDFNNSMTLQAKIWSVIHGQAMINNADVINELSNDRPLVICNASHMMVLVGVSYSPGTVNINQAWVADPAFSGSVTHGIPGLPPLAPGFRYLYPAEFTAPPLGQLTFVAAIDVF